jgi:hypothetical protein
MSVFNGTLTVLKMDGTQLAELTNVTMSMSSDNFETTSKESGGYAEFAYGQRSITYSVEGLADFQASNKDLADLLAAWTGRTVVSLEWTNGVTGDKKVTQSALISSIDVDAPMEDVSTYSVEFQGTGTPTIATI